LRSVPKTLNDIRSDACNAILATLAVVSVPAAGMSLMRGIEQGWKPVMAVHVGLLLLLGWATLRRRHLSLTLRATIATAVPFIIALGGLLTYGRGNGVMMFFISSCVVAGCFFNRRTALAVVAWCVATLMAIYLGYRFDVLTLPVNPATYDMTVISWIALGTAFVAAGAAPIIGLSALLQSLEAERNRADEAVKVRSDFLATMSHELRTPMAGIIGMSEALKASPLDAQQQSLVANLMRSGRNLLAVLNDLLDFTKFETGHVPIVKLPFRIAEEIGNVCAMFETRAARKGIDLDVELPRRLHDDVTGDSFRIGQVLSNLIDNAIKFTERGAVVVRVEQTPREDGMLILACSVTDTGIGISAEEIAHIFEPFMQADMSIARTHGGSGLGLAICRNLVDAMGGEMTVSSQPGEGSTFTVKIPLQPRFGVAANSAAVPQSVTPLPARAQVQIDRSLRLLFADDDKNMRILADIMLPRHGHSVTIVDSGAAAVEAAKANTYDCIITDMHMPVMTGSDVMRAIQKMEAAEGVRRTPMIALTADVVPEHVRAFLAAGADAVIAKPVAWDMIEAKIQELTREPRALVKAS